MSRTKPFHHFASASSGRIVVVPCALLALSFNAFAQQPPSAGSQLQQIPQLPVPERAVPRVEVKPQGGEQGGPAFGGVKIVVNSIRVTGAKAYPEAELLAVAGFKPGSELTLSELRGMALRIEDFYLRNGYFVAQAYLPAQDVKGGTVTIAVLEGKYGEIRLHNQSNLSDGLARDLLDGLRMDDPVTSGPLENRLLLLSDLPGVQVKSTLVPGASVGVSDLIVDITPGPRVSGSVDADNAGNRYTGENRIGVTVNLNDPTGHGDVASLRALTSGSGLNYARASYQMQFGKARAGVAYSHLGYSLGREFAALGATGTANIASVFGSYPLIRSRDNNLYAGLNFDAKTLQDNSPLDLIAPVVDKKAQVATASLYGNHLDNLGAGGAAAYSVSLSSGNLDIRTPAVLALDATKAQSNGHFGKLGFSATRLQGLTDTVSLYGSISGQIASKNLDVSEKMELGGMYGVRAYPEGEAFADQGYLLNLEARLLLPRFSEQSSGLVHLIAFVDTGSVTVNKSPWAAGTNNRTLSGAGVGLNWTDPNNFVVRMYYAHKLGNEIATSSPDRSGRFWIQLVKYF